MVGCCKMCAGPACPLGKSRIVFIITLLIVLGGLGFCIYWFGVRDKDYSKVKVALSQAELLDGNFCYFWISYYNEVIFLSFIWSSLVAWCAKSIFAPILQTYQAAKERCAVTNTTILNLGVNSRSDGTGTVDGNADFLAWIETYRMLNQLLVINTTPLTVSHLSRQGKWYSGQRTTTRSGPRSQMKTPTATWQRFSPIDRWR